MRRRLCCRIAARLPQTIDSERKQGDGRSAIGADNGATPNRRTAASSTPALTIVAMYAVTGTAAPS